MSEQDSHLISELFHLFYRFPLQMIPVINNSSIKGFISKDYIIKRSNDKNFFSSTIFSHVKAIVQITDDHDFFFHQIEKSSIKEIPSITADLTTIKIFAKSDFYNKYRPIERLLQDDKVYVLERLNLPIVIVNSAKFIIYYNDRFAELKNIFGLYDEIIGKHIGEHFNVQLAKNIDTFNDNSEYALRHETARIKYRIQSLNLDVGLIYIIYFH